MFLCIGLSHQSYSQKPFVQVGSFILNEKDFVREYQKHNRQNPTNTKAEIEEFIDLYHIYRAKILEMKSRNFEESPKFQDEVFNFKKETLLRAIDDKTQQDSTIAEIYERMKFDVQVSHIFIKIEGQDTSQAYKKIQSIYEQIKDKESFENLASQYNEDPMTKARKGNLGYLNVFMTVSRFEDKAYETPVNSWSKPFRSEFGYHILWIHDKRKALGKVRVAHIYRKEEPDAKKLMDEAYSLLSKNKITFAQAVKKYSQDLATQENEGRLKEFGISEMVYEFEKQCFDLKNTNDISGVFQTSFGYHIVRLIDKIPLAPFDQVKSEIKDKLQKDKRFENLSLRKFETYKSLIQWREADNELNKLASMLSADFFQKPNWSFNLYDKKIDKNAIFLRSVDASQKEKTVTFGSFLAYAADKFSKASSPNASSFLNAMAQNFKETTLINAAHNYLYETSKAAKNLNGIKNIDFHENFDDYVHGMMIFEFNESEIWSKSTKDTIGLRKFFDKNSKQDPNHYIFPQRIEGAIFVTRNDSLADIIHRDLVRESNHNKVFDRLKKGKDSLNFVFSQSKFKPSDYMIFQRMKSDFKNNTLYPIQKSDNGENYILKVIEVKTNEAMTFEEGKSKAAMRYQEELEIMAKAQLKKKYPLVHLPISELMNSVLKAPKR
jgi:peptidyl-prolyl cis-trans isomerase SurA